MAGRLLIDYAQFLADLICPTSYFAFALRLTDAVARTIGHLTYRYPERDYSRRGLYPCRFPR